MKEWFLAPRRIATKAIEAIDKFLGRVYQYFCVKLDHGQKADPNWRQAHGANAFRTLCRELEKPSKASGLI